MKILVSENPLLAEWIQTGKRAKPPEEIEIEDGKYQEMLEHCKRLHPRYSPEQRIACIGYSCWNPPGTERKKNYGGTEGAQVIVPTQRIESNLLAIQLALESEGAKIIEELSNTSKIIVGEISNTAKIIAGTPKEIVETINQVSTKNAELGEKLARVIHNGNLQVCIGLNRIGLFADRAEKFLLQLLKWNRVWLLADILLKVGLLILLWFLLSSHAKAQGMGTSFLDCITWRNNANGIVFDTCAPFTIREGTNITFTRSGQVLTIAGPAASGITTLNTLSGAIQTFATGTTGADFGISSAGTTHTFNIPSSSALNRGLLVAADWSSFNGKENVLTFSTGLTRLVNAVSCDTASALQLGCLSAANWSTFNGKQDALGFTPVPNTRLINTTAPLGGGGALSGDLTLTCTGCLTSVTAHNLYSATHGDTVTASPILGDIPYGNVTPAWTKLAGNTTATKNFLTQTGTGAVSAVPAWGTIASGDLPSHTAALATALAADPTDCGANQFGNAIAASGNLTCAQPDFSNLSGSVGDTQIAAGAVDGGIAGEIADNTIIAEDIDETVAYAFSSTSNTFAGTSYTGPTADPADAGVLRLSNGETICWEASPAGADFCITGDSSERIAATTFSGALVGNADTATTATTATTANAGDSATAFFASGTLETARMAAAALNRNCEIVVGDPGAASSALANDNDTPQVCSNNTGATLTITAVNCYSNAGSPTVTPIISGGAANSILTGALTCSQASGGAAGTLNGTPTQTDGQLIDGNITTAGGTAKYLVIRVTRTL